jgi:NTP pyrophosphatase (non-canonical NTP hydrolase)
MGASVPETGSHPTGQAELHRLDASRFDPARGDFLQHLRSRNSARLGAWEGEAKADPLFHATELGGEVGELLNVAKKLHREAMGWRGSRATEADLADEIGDVLICLDKLAAQYDIDIAAATIRKFNKTSEKVGLPQRLGVFYRCEYCGAEEDASRNTHCCPPFVVQPHAFNGKHPADRLAKARGEA